MPASPFAGRPLKNATVFGLRTTLKYGMCPIGTSSTSGGFKDSPFNRRTP
jgi:hypothetical protein